MLFEIYQAGMDKKSVNSWGLPYEIIAWEMSPWTEITTMGLEITATFLLCFQLGEKEATRSLCGQYASIQREEYCFEKNYCKEKVCNKMSQ